jgi:hypothetical protein
LERIKMDGNSGELSRLVPPVLRARDFHLYIEGGKRLTDLWQCGGRAILGHKPHRVLGELKNAAERGLFSPFPHPWEKRLIKALGELFPCRTFRLYGDEASLCRSLSGAGFSSSGFPLWRPFLESGSQDCGENPPGFIPVMPWPLGPWALVLEKSREIPFPPGEIIPPVLLATAARGTYDLIAALKAPPPNRGSPCYPTIEKALLESPWQRRGIYLSWAGNKEHYEVLFRNFLEAGFLIPPSPGEPLILPGTLSSGEEAKLAAALRRT